MDRVHLSRVERGVTCGALEIIGKLAAIPRGGPAEFFERPAKRGGGRKAN